MASSLALRRATGLFSRLRVSPAAVSHRCFSTDSQVTPFDDDDQRVDVSRRPDSSVSRRRDSFPSLNQMLNMMDQLFDSPLQSTSRGIGGHSRGWNVREDDDALYLRVDLPGLDKDQVKISVEQNTLVIKGEAEKESEDEEYGRRFSSRLDLPRILTSWMV
ncbi:hypothetical protein DH2020_004887 [Rehmannia glutinosa]|uniref:SHSP domain-containing protein n=1 Tax=Rehmannia glutinosa TaxID=99300 RepID=A0ABR0XR11_REHGL